MKILKFYISLFGLISLFGSNSVLGANLGSDLNLTLTPAAGGMGGVGYVQPQDPVASVYGNPATLVQMEGGTDFTFGASYLNVDLLADHDGSITGVPFSADSDAEHYFMPNIAVRQRLTDNLVAGGGLQVISGLGSDFRRANALAQVSELIVFGVNMDLAYDLTPKTSIGGSFTLAYGLLEFGLTSNTATQETFGFRGGLGVTHDLGPVMVGLTYNSELELDFDDVTETSPRVFNDITLEQPREVIFGLSSTPSLWPNLLVETNVIWKNWDNARGYQDLWEDNFTIALGGQYTLNKWKLRLGYSYATDLQKDNVGSSIAGITSLNVPGIGVAPITPPVVQFIQATLVQPYWQQQVSGGFGYDLSKTIHFDFQAGYAFDGDRTIGGTRIEVNEFQAGAGFTWSF